MISAGADIHANGSQALSVSSANGHLDVVERLLAAGAEPRSGAHESLRGACIGSHAAVLRKLIEAGADARVYERCSGPPSGEVSMS